MHFECIRNYLVKGKPGLNIFIDDNFLFMNPFPNSGFSNAAFPDPPLLTVTVAPSKI